MNIRNSSKRAIVFDVIIDGDVLPVRLGPGASFDPARYLAALEVVREAAGDGWAALNDDAGPSREVADPASVSVPAGPGESGDGLG